MKLSFSFVEATDKSIPGLHNFAFGKTVKKISLLEDRSDPLQSPLQKKLRLKNSSPSGNIIALTLKTGLGCMRNVSKNPGKITNHRIYFLLFAAFLVRSVTFLFSKNYFGDSPSRSLIAMEWLKDPFFIFHTNNITSVWGPLHFYLMGLFLSIYNNLLFSPRLVSLLFGSLSIIPFYKLVMLKFDKNIAFYSSLLFIFFTIHVKYSGQAACEALYIFLILNAVFFFFKYEYRKEVFLLLSVIFLNLAAMTRYDTLIFIPLLTVFLFLRLGDANLFKRISITLIFAVSSMGFMLIWFWGDYVNFGDPFFAINIAKSQHQLLIQQEILSQGVLKKSLYNLAFWPAVVFLSFTPVVALLSVIGFLRAIKNKIHLDFAILFLIPFLLFTYQSTIGASMAPFARFSMTFSVFLLPFAGLEWNEIVNRLNSKKRKLFNLFVLSTMIISFLLCWGFGADGKGFIRGKLHSVSPISRLPYWIEHILDWINTNTSQNDRIFLDYYRNEPYILRLYSKIPPENVKIYWSNNDEVLEYISENNIKYMVYSPYGKLSSIFNLNLEDSIQTDKGIKFELRFKTRYYGIFEIKRPINSVRYGHSEKIKPNGNLLRLSQHDQVFLVETACFPLSSDLYLFDRIETGLNFSVGRRRVSGFTNRIDNGVVSL